MGGTIEVHSKLGKGTEFIVNLQFRLNSNPIVYDNTKYSCFSRR